MDMIEVRLEKMCRELDFIQKENYSLRQNEEKIKNQINTLEKKYMKKNEKCNALNETINQQSAKIKELDVIVNEVKKEEARKFEETKKSKTENKKKVIISF